MSTPQTYKFQNETVDVAKTDPNAPNPYTGTGATQVTGSRGTETAFVRRYTAPTASPVTTATPGTPAMPTQSPAGTFSTTPIGASGMPTLGTVDENTIREQTRSRMQNQVDAINAQFTNLITQEKVRGEDRTGQTRAINARSGLAGQDFGNAEAQKTSDVNKTQLKYLEDEKTARIGAVLANIEDRASAEIQAKKAEALGQYDRDFAQYQQLQEQARGDLATLAKSGADLDGLNPAQKAALLKQAGYDDPAFGELVYNANKPKPQQIDYKFEKLADGKGMFYGVDPKTGELKRVDVSVDLPPDWQMQIAPDGTLIGYDKNTGEARVMSNNGQFAKQEDPLDQELKRAQIAKIEADIAGGGGSEELSVADAIKLGVPQGTTKEEARGILVKSSMSAEQQKLTANVQSGQRALKTVMNELFGYENEDKSIDEQTKLRSSILLRQKAGGARQYESATKEIKDILVRLRTGAAISENEEKYYNSQLPSIMDNMQTVKDKLKRFESLFNDIVPKNIEAMQGLQDLDPDNGGSEGTNPKAQAPVARPLSGSANTKTLASAVLPKYPPGSKGGQCVTFLHKLADFPPIGDGKKAKFASVDKFGIPKAQVASQAKVGMILITDENKTYGHGAMINAISADGKYARVTESNFKGHEKVSHDRVIALNSSRIYGAIQPKKLKSRIA